MCSSDLVIVTLCLYPFLHSENNMKPGPTVEGLRPCPASPVSYPQATATRNLLSQQPVLPCHPYPSTATLPFPSCQAENALSPTCFTLVLAAFKKQTLGATVKSIKKQQEEGKRDKKKKGFFLVLKFFQLN